MADDDARAEAERRYPVRVLSVEDGPTPDPRFAPFVAGAEWQASRTPVVEDRECDGGCNYGDGPMEDCSLHGRPVAEVWAMFATANAELAALRAAPVVADVDTIARVLALADDMDERGKPGANDSLSDATSRRQIREDVRRLRHALSGSSATLLRGAP